MRPMPFFLLAAFLLSACDSNRPVDLPTDERNVNTGRADPPAKRAPPLPQDPGKDEETSATGDGAGAPAIPGGRGKEAVKTAPPASPVSIGTAAVLRRPAQPVVFELPTEALSLWREEKERRPALVLFSFDPFLAPIPDALKGRALALAKTGSRQEIDRHGSINRPDPLIPPAQTVSAALEAGFFSRIYWIFPSRVKPSQLNLPTFREQMTKAGFLTEKEADALTLENGVYHGTVRGIPFSTVHWQRLDAVRGPMVLHIDLGFFRGLYDNEVKTPLYDLLHETAVSLRATGWKPLATSLSYSIRDGAISIDTRFLLRNLADIFRRPALLDEPMPEVWGRRAEALYAADMYSESKKNELYRANEALAPEDPTVIYDLFQGHFLAKKIDPALEALDRAAALDPGYGAAYLDLAQIALNDNNLSAALKLLDKADALFPADPFIDIGRADLLLRMNETAKALKIVERLKELSWSPVYHPEVPDLLARMQQHARNGKPAPARKAGK